MLQHYFHCAACSQYKRLEDCSNPDSESACPICTTCAEEASEALTTTKLELLKKIKDLTAAVDNLAGEVAALKEKAHDRIPLETYIAELRKVRDEYQKVSGPMPIPTPFTQWGTLCTQITTNSPQRSAKPLAGNQSPADT